MAIEKRRYDRRAYKDPSTIFSFVVPTDEEMAGLDNVPFSERNKVMDVTEFLTGNYLTAAEIKTPTTVTIKGAERELVGVGQNQQTKLVVYFDQLQKGLVANKTNLGVIANLYGTNSEAWKGKPLELYSEMVSFQGRQVPGLRVRAAPQPPAPPSAGQPQPAPQPAPVQPAQAQPGAAPWEVADQQPQQ
ncbi:MAG: hypothetical protein ABIP48_16540 [Planctomycetota bacterium]